MVLVTVMLQMIVNKTVLAIGAVMQLLMTVVYVMVVTLIKIVQVNVLVML